MAALARWRTRRSTASFREGSVETERRTMSTVLITGARGVIGSVLVDALKERELRCVDLPGVDLRDAAAARRCVTGCKRVVHLAWNIAAEDFRSGTFCADNVQMTYNVISASLAAGVRRLVFASSVHAHAYAPPPEMPTELPAGVLGATSERAAMPDSPYGASKLFGEALCRWAASHGLETVAIRFGGVNPDDAPPRHDAVERSVWLSHRDCAAAVAAALDAQLARGFALFTAVSDNPGRLHSFENELGWRPRDAAARV
jgi:uronate dehydrogenase